MAKWSALAAKVATKSIPTQSTFKLVDEKKQKKEFIPKLGYCTKEKGKLSKQLFLSEIAFPFNPETGEEDIYDPKHPDEVLYNRDNKFRLQCLNTTTAGVMKEFARRCEKTKNQIMKYTGVEEWDVSSEEVNDQDVEVFRALKRQKLYSLKVVNINLKGFKNEKNNFGQDYVIEVERDENGKIIGDAPIPILINKLFTDMSYEEINAVKARIEAGESDLTEEDFTNKKKSIRRKRILVSSDYYSQYILFFDFPLDAKYKLKDKLAQVNDVLPYLKYGRYSAEIRDSIEKLKTTDVAFDKSLDFYELDMVCPTDFKDNKELGKKTRYATAKHTIVEELSYNDFVQQASEFLEKDTIDMEKVFLRSAYIQKYHQDLDARLCDAVRDVLDLEDKALTNKVIEQNKVILSIILEDEFETLLQKRDMGLDTDREEGNLTEKGSEEVRKENVSDMVNSKDDDDDDVDLTQDNGVEEIAF